jgi:rfaE bifunctional protein nucleotidyltransferase chain/domain
MKKIYKEKELKKICDALRARGKRIVFTNGCFDILHKGHVRYLAQARKLGDVLVVGLNADRSVSALKPDRPVNPEADRAEVLAALSSVDYVTIFSEKTPYRLIKLLRPDVLVKGGDWKKREIVGADLVKETHSLPFVRGVSTTRIIGKIQSLCK